ncbi:MAG: iron ABC transporter permease [Flavobacteriales bacterium]|nr:iron ABC transporter permease [Flavobacteriales bacterium]MCB9168594.1 iron ABC transporter permease [Flavobacteriales bacterium]
MHRSSTLDPPRRPRRLFTLISLLALALAAPLLVVLTAPLHAQAPEWVHVRRVILPDHLAGTLELLGGVLAIALVLAVPSAWLVATCDFPLRRMMRWALVMPLALPTYISAFTYAALLGPTGPVSNWLADHAGFRPDIVDMQGLWFVLALVLFPYIYLPARAAFASGMSGQLDAARMLGASAVPRFRRIALPLARPAIAGGALLVAMETLNDYGAVKYYGVRTLTTGIFRSWAGLYDLGSALRLGIVLVLLVALLLWIERRARRGARQETDQVPVARVRLQGWRAAAATGWCLLVFGMAAMLPIGSILDDVRVTWDGTMHGQLPHALWNTSAVAAVAGLVTLVIAVLFTFRERYGRRSDPAIRLADLGYVIPGAVIAIGVMSLAGFIDRRQWLDGALIGSMGVLVYAFSVRFLAVGKQPLQGALRQQSTALDEAARMLGASPWRSFRRVNLPLLGPALIAAAMLVAIDVIKELPLTLILRPFNFDTLSTKAYELARIEQLREASWPSLMIVICGLVPVLLLERMLERRARSLGGR